MANNYNLAALGQYTDQMSFELISKAVLTTNIMNYATVRSGLRAGQVAINVLDASDNSILITDRSCGWPVDPSGDLIYTQVTLDMIEKQTKQSLCPTSLRDYYLSEKLSASAHAEETPFEEVVSELFVKRIKNFNEGYIAGELFSTITVAAGAADSGQTAASDFSTVLDDVLNLCNAVDPSVLNRDDLGVIMSPAQFNLFRRALVAQNYFHYIPGQIDNANELMIPGTDFKAIKGTFSGDGMLAGPLKDIVVGVGLEDDFDTLKIFYSQDNDEVRVMSAWRLGVGVVDLTKWAKNGTL